MKYFIHFILLVGSISLAIASDEKYCWGKGIAPYFKLYLSQSSELYEFGNEGPCGKYLNLQGFRIPFENNNFEMTWVYELSKSGERIKKWPVPADASVYMISGETIMVGIPNEYNKYVYINSKAQIVRATDIDTPPIQEFVDCPIKEGSEYKYHACVDLIDPSTNKHRIISTWPICS